LLFVMKPWYALRPRQLDGLRVVTIADPLAVSRAWALKLLADGLAQQPADEPLAPAWVRHEVPWLRRFWGEGLSLIPPLGVNETIFQWARTDPKGLRAAARALASFQLSESDPDERRLMSILTRFDRPDRPGGQFAARLLAGGPAGLIEAVEILIAHPDAVRTVLTRCPYTDPATIGGYLDRDLPAHENDR
jgi:hypothetical protein